MTAVEARLVSKRYGRGREGRAALTDVSVRVQYREIVGLIGPNGAGKTTLLRILAGLALPTTGHILRPSWPKPGSVKYFGGEHTMPADISARRWHRLFDPESATAVPDCGVSILSRGTRQRVGLAAVLSSDDGLLLLLDEPWEGLDPDASRWLSDELLRRSERGWSLVVSSHRIHDLAAICHRCEFLCSGRLASTAFEFEPSLDSAERAVRLFRAYDEAQR